MELVTFRDLVEGEARRGRPAHLPPRTFRVVAARLGMSMSHLYNLMGGVKDAPSWTVARIAKRLDVPVALVERALKESKKQGAKS